MPKMINREYRAMAALQARSEDDQDSCRVEGYAATFEQPYLIYDDGDTKIYETIDRAAFEGCDMSDVILQYDHEGKVLARTRNASLTLTTDSTGLHVVADLSLSEEGRKLYEEIKNGLVDRMSFGFVIAEDSYQRETRTRRILKIKKLYDVSAVSVPANDGTHISARSDGHGFVDDIVEELRQRDLALLLLKLRLNEGEQKE